MSEECPCMSCTDAEHERAHDGHCDTCHDLAVTAGEDAFEPPR